MSAITRGDPSGSWVPAQKLHVFGVLQLAISALIWLGKKKPGEHQNSWQLLYIPCDFAMINISYDNDYGWLWLVNIA